MAKINSRNSGNNQTQFNLTPMIDCTFQLIIFFILVAQISNEELAPMIVPEPNGSQARSRDKESMARPNVAIVNIWNIFGQHEEVDGITRLQEPLRAMEAMGYSVGMEKIKIHDIPRLTEVLRQEKAKFDTENRGGPFYVEVRADKDLSYHQILPVMTAAGNAGIAQMFMTAVTDPHRNVEFSGNGG